MAGQQIAQYFAKVGLIVENKEFAKVDKALKDVEKQLEKVVGGSAKETKAKKEATAATEKKAKAVEKEAKATKDLNKEQEKQSKDVARRIKQQQALLKKADADAMRQANTFAALQKRLANSNPALKALSQKQIAANRSAFFSSARASDIRTGYGAQYRLGAQADAKIRQMVAAQNALFASRAIGSPISNNKVFEELQLRLASKLRTPRHLTESQINKNRAAFFSSAKALETKTGQGLQYRLGDQVAKIQQATQRQQEQAAVRKPTTIVMPQTPSGRLSNVNLFDRLAHLDQDIGSSKAMQQMSAYYRKMETDAISSARRIAKEKMALEKDIQTNIQRGIRETERLNTKALSEVDKALGRMRLRGVGSATPPSSGGGNGGGQYRASHTSPMYFHKDRMHLFGGTGIGFAPGPWGAGAAVAGLTIGGAYFAGQQINQLRRDQTTVEMQRTQLDVASGYTSRPFQDAQNKKFFELANQTGASAGTLIGSYSQMMKTLIAQGQQAEGAFDLYKNMTLFAKGSGANDMQIERASYAIGQVYGKGYLSREEWALQLADALPGLRKFLIQVTGEQLGVKTGADLDKALEAKTITPDMLVEAFRRAGQYALPMVETYAGTAQAAENRLANITLEEQMARTLSDDVIPAAKNLIKAQENLYEAMEPLRDTFYELSSSVLNTTADILNFGSFLANKHLPEGSKMSEFAKDASPLLIPMTLAGPTGLLAQMALLFKNFTEDDKEALSSVANSAATNNALARMGLGNTISGNTFNFEISLEGGTEGLKEFVDYGIDERLLTTLKYFGQNQ